MHLVARNPFRQARTALTAAVAAVVLCMLCLAAAMFWRSTQYDDLAARHADEQQAVFRRAFPGFAVPADVRSRLASDEKSLRGPAGDSAAPRSHDPGLVTFRDLMSHLPSPDELRYRVLEVRLDPAGFTLDGQAVSHADADVIVAALRKGGRFTVDPPRTEQLGRLTSVSDGGDKPDAASKGVSFTITGTARPTAMTGRTTNELPWRRC